MQANLVGFDLPYPYSLFETMANNKSVSRSNLPSTKPPLLPKPKFLLTAPKSPRKPPICNDVVIADQVEETSTLSRIESPETNVDVNENCSIGKSVEIHSDDTSLKSDVNDEVFDDSPKNSDQDSLVVVKTTIDDFAVEPESFTSVEELAPSDSPVERLSLVNRNSDSFRKRLSSWVDETFLGGKKSDDSPRSESQFYIDDVSLDVPSSTSQQSFDVSYEPDSVNSSSTPKSKEREAFLIAKEFVTSEQIYVDALRLIVVNFRDFINDHGHSKNYNSVIPKNDIEKIVTHLPQLLSLNEDLLNDLEARISSWEECPKMADVIVKKGPFLKLYSTYMRDFESQCSHLDECCVKYPGFAKALAEFEKSPRCRKLTLKHYMLKPVQRIPQYRLLLENYLEQLPPSSSEFSDAKTALNVVQDVLHHANSSIKLGDNLSKLLQLQSSLGNYVIIKPGRLFIKEGELQKLSRKDLQLRFFILLSDCLLYTTYLTSISGLRVKYEFPLSGMKVNRSEVPEEFYIITNTRSFGLRARNEEECSEWIKSLQQAIKENNQRQLTFLNMKCMVKSFNSEALKLGKEAPVWVQDKKTTMCQICTAEFTVTFRRHHCRCCGKVVCGVCSNNKAPLQYLKFESARVCGECFDYLWNEFEDPESKIFDHIQNDLGLSDHEAAGMLESLKNSFKKNDSIKRIGRSVPERLKVTANDRGSQMSGWLERRRRGSEAVGKRRWKRQWFVLKDQVLYMYKASHNVVAHQTVPVLGYTVGKPQLEYYDDLNPDLLFSLEHPGQSPLIFCAPNKQSAEMWITALREATVLS